MNETILQFGSGRFLRAFADLIISQAQDSGQEVGKIVMVQSTGKERVEAMNKQQCQYHVVIRGFAEGDTIDRVERCHSISRALHAGSQWQEVLKVAVSPLCHTILSNTTEAGYHVGENEEFTDAVPESFPAKLLRVLFHRWQLGQPAPTVIPCELIEGNAQKLKSIVDNLVTWWALPDDFRHYVLEETIWLHTLVDRIVTGTPAEHPLLAEDPMTIVAEPYALWAIEKNEKSLFHFEHKNVVWTEDVQPYFLRKVRILNAAHTALLGKAVPRGFRIVREAVNDPELGAWLWQLLSEEIVPTLEGRIVEGLPFARQTIDRFKNPFLDHKFSDIFLHHEEKIEVRLRTTQKEFTHKFQAEPQRLTEAIDAGLKLLQDTSWLE